MVFRKKPSEAALRMHRSRAELDALHAQLHDARTRFDSAADPALAEAAILEIGALELRYGCVLRTIKELDGELSHDHARRFAAAGHRRCDARSAAQAAETAHQMGL